PSGSPRFVIPTPSQPRQAARRAEESAVASITTTRAERTGTWQPRGRAALQHRVKPGKGTTSVVP
ncbi:MAG: hypothetical protein WAN17_20280, partial [Candidatus Sulfotelmatobacter sp.]